MGSLDGLIVISRQGFIIRNLSKMMALVAIFLNFGVLDSVEIVSQPGPEAAREREARQHGFSLAAEVVTVHFLGNVNVFMYIHICVYARIYTYIYTCISI